MRIITRKLHRAFAELDHYSDEQCKQYLANLRQNKMRFSLRLILLPVLLTLLYFFAVPFGLGNLIKYLQNHQLIDMGRDAHFYPIFLAGAVFWWIGSGIVFLMSRDLFLGKELSKIVNSQLQITRCLGCSYSLIGQTPDGDRLVCPECGHRTTLQELGITLDDLIPPMP
ncbi:MAG TPA: hypothetical protein DCM28_14700 [Phycisphaerales bacterium]|nr:hypothetical protein [Phycisphaerales bacterium]HCD31780.1 hypothetical protein [Phycisphaerales bacterium]|tara:strand:+ start:758 stop:1264 length:507 start_codon:yes stop_codon:yes gene_type:complete